MTVGSGRPLPDTFAPGISSLDPRDTFVLQNGAGQQQVLVVEDERMILDLMAEHLCEEGYLVRTATTLEQALAHLETELPALLVLDLMLPGRSGWDFLAQRRQNPPLAALPVLVVSAAHRDHLDEALQLGATACLHKPFDLDELSRVVRALSARRLVRSI